MNLQLAAFFRRLEAMFGAGIPLHAALAALARTETGELGEALGTVVRDLEQGRRFSQALARHGTLFPPVAVHLVATGEQTGALHKVLGKLADYFERTVRLRQRAQAALIYPAALVVATVTLLLFLSWVVIPQERKLLQELGGSLPGLTRVVLGVLDLLPLAGVVALGALQGLVLLRHRPWRDGLDEYLLRVPVVGTVLYKLALARVFSALATMLAAGMPLKETGAAGRVAGNAWLEASYARFLELLRHGSGLAAAARASGGFPPLACSLFGVAEEHGGLERVMERLAVACEQDVEPLLDLLVGLLEPAILVFMGVCVGLSVLAFLLPMSAALSRLG